MYNQSIMVMNLKFTYYFSSLGVNHDQSDECPDGTNIMATGTAYGKTLFQWSKCSSKAIKAAME